MTDPMLQAEEYARKLATGKQPRDFQFMTPGVRGAMIVLLQRIEALERLVGQRKPDARFDQE